MAENNSVNSDQSSEQVETSKPINRSENRLLKYTETIDRLVVQNKQLQKDLSDSESEINDLHDRINDSNIRVSKNLFYIGLVVIGFFVYSGNKHLTDVEKQLVEMNVVLKEYKMEIERTKQYNELLEKNLGIQKDPKKIGGK